MKRLGRTRPFRTPRGEVVPGSIAEVAYLRLGGLDQWVMIRGENVDNPPLIFLHGGPGWSETAWLRYFNAPLERHFTVVYWDQRGTGKSFTRHIPRASMTVEQFMSDLDELVDAVCNRLGKTKVVIFGHSWGTVLGALYAARFPQKVAVYVGGAQIGDWPTTESRSYAFAVAEAQRQGADRAMKKLRAIGPPPYSADSVFTERTAVLRLDGRASPKEVWKIARAALTAPESSLLDAVGAMRGFRFSMNAMWPEVSRLNLIQLAPILTMPVFLLLGRKDHWVPPETSMDYFNALTAPSKQVVWFEESAHEMFVDEPARFNQTMISLVRPVAAT
jgi:pimeloyl-ACP methyl ester carboxylesterase